MISWRLPIVLALAFALSGCGCKPVERVVWFSGSRDVSEGYSASFKFPATEECRFAAHGIGFYQPIAVYDMQMKTFPKSSGFVNFDALGISRSVAPDERVDLVRGTIYLDLTQHKMFMDLHTADGAFRGNGSYEIQ